MILQKLNTMKRPIIGLWWMFQSRVVGIASPVHVRKLCPLWQLLGNPYHQESICSQWIHPVNSVNSTPEVSEVHHGGPCQPTVQNTIKPFTSPEVARAVAQKAQNATCWAFGSRCCGCGNVEIHPMLLSPSEPFNWVTEVMLQSQQESRHRQFWLDPFRFCKPVDSWYCSNSPISIYWSCTEELMLQRLTSTGRCSADHLGMFEISFRTRSGTPCNHRRWSPCFAFALTLQRLEAAWHERTHHRNLELEVLKNRTTLFSINSNAIFLEPTKIDFNPCCWKVSRLVAVDVNYCDRHADRQWFVGPSPSSQPRVVACHLVTFQCCGLVWDTLHR